MTRDKLPSKPGLNQSVFKQISALHAVHAIHIIRHYTNQRNYPSFPTIHPFRIDDLDFGNIHPCFLVLILYHCNITSTALCVGLSQPRSVNHVQSTFFHLWLSLSTASPTLQIIDNNKITPFSGQSRHYLSLRSGSGSGCFGLLPATRQHNNIVILPYHYTALPIRPSAHSSSQPEFCFPCSLNALRMTNASDQRSSPATNPVNTAKLSSPILIPRTVSYDVGTNPPRRGTAYQTTNMGDQKTGRRRRSSSILQIYQEPLEPIEQLSDQSALPNLNANWVNAKGAWTIHIVLIVALKILWDVIPGVSQETSWTLTNISYMFGSYIMFHWVRGVPFDFNSGAYDNLNMWEQIDDGAQYTPAKKFLLSVPIVLFLLSTHYTHYDLAYFTINFLAVLGVVIPKLPFSHRMRVGLFSGVPED
ncbi:hypothetical protein GQX73_g166 [Xylaria multiplex]|uniref:Protein ORM1 n=1 Tax=Xylaria multiplex TaxID=323545 RepID=A0A7C8J8J8_9PEZI|nr:hypothetical protein GQX73_g166 [Xylaria multiplex]